MWSVIQVSDTWVVSSSASGISSPNRKSLTSIGREAVLFLISLLLGHRGDVPGESGLIPVGSAGVNNTFAGGPVNHSVGLL